ncbi:hypothetical protein, partial [Methanosarcina sp. 2.H.T.1A.3]|uniref:hypothetical protein n=1 Tax=Methanosarcina sp. 2.H.T.1A.3 TaxID=1483597 RepID=UPI00064ECFD2
MCIRDRYGVSPKRLSPHGATGEIGAAIYARGDSTEVFSWNDGTTGSANGDFELSTTNFAKYDLITDGSTFIKFYQNDILKYTATNGIPSASSYQVFFYGDEFSTDSASYLNYVFARKYASTEPTVTVEDMGSWYKVFVTNNGDEELTDYQVAIPSTDLSLDSTEESLYITKMNSSQ